ncbi:SMI1/KNR4 family protein [Deinococcus sp. QL22]|uniref:SMI1/KNR4 family protein n=1 Tax=Deinococcus sp. QL22 TaxID=2939437 RepID=UPI002016FC65|nr:SMI1/KNR4 family protein [Deinococcus sp. QL22]UQN05282.1 SMI1/KNR4 family protein [Deinococcus sp. QL22]
MTRIKTWLQSEVPEMLEDLNPPLTDQENEFLVEEGIVLSAELLQLYRLHNGQAGKTSSIFGGYEFMDCWLIIQEHTMATDFSSDKTMDLYVQSFEGDKIVKVFPHPGRIAFAGPGGTYLAVDLAPASKGISGQVINCGRDDQVMYVLADSLGEFLTLYADMLESGVIEVINDPDLGNRLDSPHHDNLISLFLAWKSKGSAAS